ncbi:conserved hypothetical protein (UPF0118) [Alteracholeplasma palmae J233]|uniref:Permease n=1 Tax=Alteracholeplasma palmae (strain ATCC 49389 / J233) TaxID=1318466 RepID=U4KQF0_ALTPJ|nr:AI-2E family transporter [Alteracholeplasma palmae]CCV64545.1 conserved hypothetical protein (UPF0118) [Alteracholeplasma palmae J233]
MINKKLINILVLLAIIYVAILLIPYAFPVAKRILIALLPLIFAFILAFVLNPAVNFLERFKVHRGLAIVILYSTVIIGITLIVIYIIKPAVPNLTNLSNGVRNIITEIGQLFNINTDEFSNYVVEFVDKVVARINNLFTATNGTVEEVAQIFIGAIVMVIVGITFLFNFNKIKQKVTEHLKEKNEHTYQYVKTLSTELNNYVRVEIIIAGIQFLEYTTLFLILSIFNHALLPYALIVGITASVLSLIPYFGGYLSITFSGIVIMGVAHAAIPILGLIIFMLIFPQLDGYVINPKIYKKQLKINPVISIAFVLVGSAVFGIYGTILSLPVLVITVITYRYYHEPIKSKLKQMKDSI